MMTSELKTMSDEDGDEKRTTKNFKDLDIWRRAHGLVLEIYKITRRYPQEERYGLVSQMRRAAVSVPANIAEGFRKKGIRDKLNFYNVAQASLDELCYYIILSNDLEYIHGNAHLLKEMEEIARMLSGWIKSIEIK